MPKYDIENLLEDIHQTLLSNLDSKIDEINTEKDDDVQLEKIDPQAYVLQQLDGGSENFNPILLFGEDDVQTISNGPFGEKKHILSAVIIVADNGQDLQIGKRMFRYRRALEEIFQENWNGGGCAVKLEVKSLVPVPMTNLNSKKSSRAVGVQIEANLG